MTNYLSIQLSGWVNALFITLKKIPLFMRLSTIMLFMCIGLTYAAESYSQSTLLTLDINQQTVQDVLDEIEKQSDFHFFYNNKQVNTNRVVSIKTNKKNVFTILDQLFDDTDVSYRVVDKSIILSQKELISEAVVQQAIVSISGTVTDSNGEAIIGANIVEKGSTNGTITDLDGHFNLTVPRNSILVISYIGYISKEIQVGNNLNYAIQLAEDTKTLDEVVVTALGIRREEKALGYAVQKVDGDKLATVKTVDMATTLTGQIAGLNIKNKTDFNQTPDLSLRGETPLLVVDGVPYYNITLRDIASDDIASIDVLKGATASALYGSRGGSGAVMVTTKKANEEGLHVTVNSNTMFDAGYVKKPEVQTAYSSGGGGRYGTGDYVWGDKLDIGRTARQYNPFTHDWEEMPLVSKGKNNLKNFQEFSFITNNNISVAQRGKYGSVRTSLTHVYNKGQFPNQKLNKFTYTVSGDMKYKDFTFEGGLTYNKQFYPNDIGSGYGGQGYLYNLVVWTGTEIDIRDYKNYWVKENEDQNWMDKNWYDNPYYTAHEIIQSKHRDVTNAYFNTSYDFTPWLKAALRSGIDSYSEKEEWQNPINASGGWSKKGYYGYRRKGGYSINSDALLIADKTVGDFALNGLAGGSIYYWEADEALSETQNGITIPGFYSLNASVDPVKTGKTYKRKQVNSFYGKASIGWKSTLFLDITARNDWSSTLDADTRSYFYPSVAGSAVLSEFIPLPDIIGFWKVRASWTQTKQDLSVYDTNAAYTIATNQWDGLNTAEYPTTIRGALVKPSATRSWEVGMAFSMFQNRLRFDATYYNKLYYNLTQQASVSPTSGFLSSLINIDEEQLRKGVEITVSGDIIQTKDFTWSASVNWALDRYTYNKIDPVYSLKKPWVQKGKRWDWLGYKSNGVKYAGVTDYERDPQGNVIHLNGYPVISKYESCQGYTEPDWMFGINNTLRYKDFTLNFTIDGRVGGVLFSTMDQAMWNSGSHIDSDTKWRYDEVVDGKITYVGQGVKVISGSVDYDAYGNITRDDRQFAPNDEAVSYEAYMKRGNPYIGTMRTQNIFDQTYFKLRNLSISYNCPSSIYQKIGLKGASIGFVGQNLLVWTKDLKFVDPDRAEDNLNAPSIRYMGVNLKLDF